MSVKKFKFRLEKLLGIKKQEEKRLQGEFFNLKNELYEIERKIRNKEKEIEHSFVLMKNEESNDINSIEMWQRYIHFLKNEKLGFEKEKTKKEELVEKKRKELLEKIKERKALEILKEKQYVEYLKEINREEQKFIDEINTTRYKREE